MGFQWTMIHFYMRKLILDIAVLQYHLKLFECFRAWQIVVKVNILFTSLLKMVTNILCSSILLVLVRNNSWGQFTVRFVLSTTSSQYYVCKFYYYYFFTVVTNPNAAALNHNHSQHHVTANPRKSQTSVVFTESKPTIVIQQTRGMKTPVLCSAQCTGWEGTYFPLILSTVPFRYLKCSNKRWMITSVARGATRKRISKMNMNRNTCLPFKKILIMNGSQRFCTRCWRGDYRWGPLFFFLMKTKLVRPFSVGIKFVTVG